MTLRVFAPAKINLTLEVGAAKANGRHPLRSVVAFADVGDWIEATLSAGLSLSVSGAFAAALERETDNLVLGAARLLGVPDRGAALQLTKLLPVASGIGGGSSDAAATLKALNALWSLGLSETKLMQLGAELGGDVPVCVFARSAYMTGEGEIVAPMALPPLDAVLVNPGVAAPTSAVFARFDALNGGASFNAADPAPVWRTFPEVCEGVAARGNMLAAAARLLAPEIVQVEAALGADPAARCVSLSGSGATVFALTESREAARRLAERISAKFPDWWVIDTTLALDADSGAR